MVMNYVSLNQCLHEPERENAGPHRHGVRHDHIPGTGSNRQGGVKQDERGGSQRWKEQRQFGQVGRDGNDGQGHCSGRKHKAHSQELRVGGIAEQIANLVAPQNSVE